MGLDLVEMCAIYCMAPPKFHQDLSGKKEGWRTRYLPITYYTPILCCTVQYVLQVRPFMLGCDYATKSDFAAVAG